MGVFAGYGLQYLTDLKAIAPALRCNLMCIAVQEKKAFYQFDDSATDDADNNLIVAPNEGEGRWFALGAPSSGGEGGGGSGGQTIYRSNNSDPRALSITPEYPGQMFVAGEGNGSDYFNRSVYVAFGPNLSDWQLIYYFSNS